IVQLIAPWLLFLPQPIASFAATAIIITQLALVITGNYAWLNWATILLACAGISDSFFHWIVGGPWPEWGIDAAVRRVDEASLAEATGTPADTLTSPLWWVLLIV
ncbi:lipase maturation factor family protein, partial [Mycobacterium tuberculosis]|nr:lipase maturation factor family protein [Mycobacterium tuberculosis]